MWVCRAGAIMLYLAQKQGSPLVPPDLSERAKMLTWLMFQMCGLRWVVPGCTCCWTVALLRLAAVLASRQLWGGVSK